MALFHMCLEEGMRIAAAHVNYHHRPQADEEEAYVTEVCRTHGVPCHVRNAPFGYTGNFEAAARDCRYRFFRDLISRYGYSGVMTAHHQDDLLETYLMQEEKGIIPDTWGISENRMIEGVRVKRPLLGYTKQQLEDYCQSRGIKTYHDATNDDTSLTRNRIRHETVAGLSPFEREMILREIRRKNAQASEQRCRIGTYITEGSFERSRYLSLPQEERLTLLRMILKEELPHASRSFLAETDHVIASKADFMIPCHKRQLVQKNGKIFLFAPEPSYAFSVPDKEALFALKSPHFRIEQGTPGVNALTLKESDFPLVIRCPRPGDRIRMRFGFKAVHRFFIDRHIPLFERSLWPVVENAEGTLILVSGLGCEPGHYSIRPDVSVIQYSAYG